jgi:TPP-dependent trihydroxycyclohexane-1,2-dione (THcHDO) dehydratase
MECAGSPSITQPVKALVMAVTRWNTNHTLTADVFTSQQPQPQLQQQQQQQQVGCSGWNVG